MENKTILITGAAGLVGKAFVDHFCSLNWKVIALCRTIPKNKNTNANYVVFNLGEEIVHELLQQSNYVVHCALDKNNTELNYVGSKALIDQCRAHSVKFVFISSFSAHNEAISSYGKDKVRVENYLDANKEIILKLGLVVGDNGLFNTMKNYVLSNKLLLLLDGGKQPLQLVTLADCCRALKAAMQSNGGVYWVASGNVISIKQLYQQIEKISGKKKIYFSVPLFLVELAVGFFSFFGIKFLVSKDNVQGLKQLKSFDVSDTEKKLHIKFASAEEAITNALK